MASDQYAVIGNPVSHSLSPTIHARFAEQTGQDMDYGRIEADDFAAAAAGFIADGGHGLNVTVPFKADAFHWCDQASERAHEAGAVNTLTRGDEGRVTGDNTDGIGLVRDLHGNLGLSLIGARILIVGAGGAAGGALGPLLEGGPAQLVIANRTVARAEALADAFAGTAPVAGCSFEALAAAEPFDLVINASAASLAGALPPLSSDLLAARGTVYDMMYGDAAAAFLKWGRGAGATVVSDGLGMLVEQAAESFWIWRGIRPQTASVLTELRAGRDC